MIINFTVGNYRSFKDKKVLSGSSSNLVVISFLFRWFSSSSFLEPV